MEAHSRDWKCVFGVVFLLGVYFVFSMLKVGYLCKTMYIQPEKKGCGRVVILLLLSVQ